MKRLLKTVLPFALGVAVIFGVAATYQSLMIDGSGNCGQAVNFTNTLNLSGVAVATQAYASSHGGSGGVSSVTASLPIISSGTSTPNISFISAVQGAVFYDSGTGWSYIAPGDSGKFLKTQGAGANPIWDSPAGSGNVAGPGSSTDNAITRFDGVGGTTIQNSLATINDSGTVNIPTGQTYKINGTALAASDVGAVPTSRQVNGHALTGDVTVSASDITTGTLPASRLPSATTSAKGAIQLEGSGNTAKYLNGAGSWTVPAGGGGGSGNVTGPESSTSGNFALFDSEDGTLIRDGGTPGTAAFRDVGTDINNVMQIDGAGYCPRLHTIASDADFGAGLNIPSGVAPTSPVSGDTWYDGTHLYFRNGSTNKDLLATGGGGGVTSVSGTAPVASSGGTTPAISMAKATASVDGYLDHGDFATFAGKQAALGFTAVPTSRQVNGHALSSDVIVSASDVGAVPTSRQVNGHALSSDVTVSASDVGAVPTSRQVNGHALSSDVTVSASDISTGTLPSAQLPSATTSAKGAIQLEGSGDTTKYLNGNGVFTVPVGGGGGVTSVSGTAPVASSGGTTPAISMAKATASVDGYLDHGDFATFAGKQAALGFTPISNALTSANIIVGNGSNVAAGVALSGDATIGNTGAITVTKTNGTSFGTAATLNAGTAASNLVQLNGSAKLPAVDGSQLTNLTSSGANPSSFINGGLNVWQLGDAFAGGSTGTRIYTADGWQVTSAGAALNSIKRASSYSSAQASFSATLGSNAGGANLYSHRQIIPSTTAPLAKVGTRIRVTFTAGAAGLHCDHAAVGYSAGSGATTATPVELLFGGSSGFTIGAGASATSDFLTFPVLPGQDIVTIMDVSSSGATSLAYTTGLASSLNDYNKPSATYNVVAPSGLNSTSGAGAVYLVSKVEFDNYTASLSLPAGSSDCLEINGAASVTTVNIDQRLEAQEAIKYGSASFSAYVFNGTGSAVTPVILVGTPAAYENFTTVTTINGSGSGENLQSCANGAWTKVTWSANISAYSNLANGLQVTLQIPTGVLVATKTMRFTEFKFEQSASPTVFVPETADIAEMRCKRFLEILGQGGATAGAIIFRANPTAGSQSYIFNFPIMKKRVIPTMSFVGTTWGMSNCTGLVAILMTQTTARISATSTAAGDMLFYTSDATSGIQADSRL